MAKVIFLKDFPLQKVRHAASLVADRFNFFSSKNQTFSFCDILPYLHTLLQGFVLYITHTFNNPVQLGRITEVMCLILKSHLEITLCGTALQQ